MLKMELSRIVISETSEEQIIILKEAEGSRSFPIVVGLYEAATLDRKIKKSKTPRPLPHDLMENIIRGFNAVLSRVIVHELRHNTFYAKLVLHSNGKEIEVDARPSDAIILAVQMKVPIYVEEKVINQLTDSATEVV
jgi:hypothetical protein